MRAPTSTFSEREDGATAAEYAILLALILMAVITAIKAVGDTSTGVWANDANKIQSAVQGS
jgi:pilus assembly protein Flp/PilA